MLSNFSLSHSCRIRFFCYCCHEYLTSEVKIIGMPIVRATSRYTLCCESPICFLVM